MRRPIVPAFVLSGSLLLFSPSTAYPASAPLLGATTRVSVGANGAQANEGGAAAAISADARYVAITSGASNLVANDTNGLGDVFVRDRVGTTTTRVSVSSLGTQGNGESGGAAISADGRYVAFSSAASNLVAGDTNGRADVFVRDRVTGATSRVSVASSGSQADGHSGFSSLYGFSTTISANGRYVVFYSDADNLVTGDTNAAADVFVHDRVTGTTTRVSLNTAGTQADGWSGDPAISADGRYVAFGSSASNLVAGDTNEEGDVFVHDRVTGGTTRVSVATGGTQARSDNGEGSSGPEISANGRYVAFGSRALNLVPGDTNGEGDVFLRDRETGTTSVVSINTAGKVGSWSSYLGAMSADARFVAFNSPNQDMVPGDTNGTWDAFLRDRSTVVPPTAFGDFNRDGWSDVVARYTPTGALYLYRGTAAGLTGGRVQIGTGWQSMSAITRFDDFTRDGREDLIARQGSTGTLWLYPGTGTGLGKPVKVGPSGWNGMREITAVGDLTGDRYPDLLAVQSSTGKLHLYPGRGTSSLRPGRLIGTGWNSMSELTGVGDFNRDGHVDLIARYSSTGSLWLYPGKLGGLGPRVRVGGGWKTMRDLAGIGDLDRDGYTDLIAVQSATRRLFWYPGRGSGFRAPLQIGTGWTTAYRPLL